jgi:hypothetical protein
LLCAHHAQGATKNKKKKEMSRVMIQITAKTVEAMPIEWNTLRDPFACLIKTQTWNCFGGNTILITEVRNVKF